MGRAGTLVGEGGGGFCKFASSGGGVFFNGRFTYLFLKETILQNM